MSSDRQKRIAEIAWQRVAEKVKVEMFHALHEIFVDYTFLSKDDSMRFGSRYWARVEEEACPML